MGKDKKDKKKEIRFTPFDYMPGGRVHKMAERYGVDTSEYNVNYGRDTGNGGREWKGGRDEYHKAIQAAAMRDYDTRRTMEAKALSGNGKARKYAEEGFGNITDVVTANKLREKWHKKAGNGGSFSSESDFAGQTWGAVEDERKSFNSDINSRMDTRFDEMQGMLDEYRDKATRQEENQGPIELSEEMKRASDQINEYELNLGLPSLDLNLKTGQDPAKADEANNYAAAYRQKVAGGLRNSTTDSGYGDMYDR